MRRRSFGAAASRAQARAFVSAGNSNGALKCDSLLKIRRLRSVFTQYRAPFTPHRQIRHVRARYGLVPYFDRRVGFLTRPDAIKEIFDVRFDRNPALVFVGRLRGFVRPGPRFGINVSLRWRGVTK